MTLTSTINNEKCRFYNDFSSNIVFRPAQGAPQHSVKHKKRQLHYILFAIENDKKKRGPYKNPQLIWEYLAMHN